MASPIEQEIFINAPVDVVWRTVTEPEQVRRWFAEQVDFNPEPGSEGTLIFHTDSPEERLAVNVTVTSVEPTRSFTYRWHYPPGATPAAGNSLLVEFTLTPKGQGTRLRVVESGLEETGWPRERRNDYFASHVRGWATYVVRLRDLLETGAAAEDR